MAQNNRALMRAGVAGTILLLVFWLRVVVSDPAEPRILLSLPEWKIDPVNEKVLGEAISLEALFARWNLYRPGKPVRLNGQPGERQLYLLLVPNVPQGRLQLDPGGLLDVKCFALGLVQDPEHPDTFIPDVLVPLKSFAGELIAPSSGVLFPRKARWQLLLLEFTLPETLSHPASLHLKWRAAEQSVALTFQVQPVASRPENLDFWLDLNEYGDKYLKFLGKKRRKLTLEDRLPWDRRSYTLARQHQAVLNLLPYKSQAGSLRKFFGPRLLNEDLLNPRLDWEEFDRRFGPYLDGTAFADGQPIRHFYLPFNPDWPAPFELYHQDRQRYEAIWAAFARQFIQHFQQKGWTRTIFQVYCNQKPGPNNAIPWHLDEPKGVEDYRALRYYADLTHRVFAGADPVKVRFRIDISHFYCDEHRGSRAKDFRVNGGDQILFPAVDIWVISDHSLYGKVAARKAARLRQQGREVWVYGDTPPLLETGWLATWRIYHAFARGWNGFMAWKTFIHQVSRSKGKNFLLYDLNLPEATGIFPSLRLKLLWRAIEDLRCLAAQMSTGKLDTLLEKWQNALQQGSYRPIWEFRTQRSDPRS